jgi:hypothetical protein
LKKNWNDDEKKVLIWIIGKISAMKAVDLKNIVPFFGYFSQIKIGIQLPL